MKKDKVRIWVYGTLKKGRALHDNYMGNSLLIQEDTMRGELYKIGWYPAFFQLGDRIADIKGEIYEMPREDFNKVRQMEENAGYKTEEMVSAGGIKAHVFRYLDSRVKKNGQYMLEF